jgi:hypothetical protein
MENLTGVLAILVVLIGMGYLFYIIKQKVLDELQLQSDLEWLKKEETKPRTLIKFNTKNGETYTTGVFDPENSLAGNDWNIRYTSRSLAKMRLKRYFSQGYIIRDNSEVYPICNIEKAWIELEDKDGNV